MEALRNGRRHFNEIKGMLEKWYEHVVRKVNGKPFDEYFKNVKVEEKLVSDEYNVCGVVDLIDEKNGSIVEYKTSEKDEMKREYKLQIGIYALLFWEKFRRFPNKVIVHFLKHGEKEEKLGMELINEAKKNCKLINLKTIKRDIEHYQKIEGPLCKWGSGKCDFYGRCFS